MKSFLFLLAAGAMAAMPLCAQAPSSMTRLVKATRRAPARDFKRQSVPGYISTFDNAFAHIAYNGIWVTRMTVVNYRATPVSVGLYFYSDDGSPAEVAIYGNTDPGSAWSINLAAYGTFNFETLYQPRAAGTSGSGALDIPCTDTNNCGQVGAFAVFQGVGSNSVQEAVVPVATCEAQRASIAFDNTGGYATGVAISYPMWLGPAADTFLLTARDNHGNILATDSISMAENGHMSFMLADKYAALKDKRGSITVTTSDPNAAVAILGISANATGAYTTLPSFQP